MFNGLKMVACGLATVCFVSAAGALGTKASDNTLIGDFNGDGKEEIVSYAQEKTSFDNGDFGYSFRFTIDGKQVYEEDLYVSTENNTYRNPTLDETLDHLDKIDVQKIDINPGKAGEELVARYFADVDDIVLGYRVFRYKKGEIKAVSEFVPEAAHSYIYKAQDNNDTIKVAIETCTPTLGNIWLTRNYTLKKDGFVEKESKSGTYAIAPAKYEENKLAKYNAATEIEIFSDKKLKNSKGMIAEGEKFTIKKVILTDNNTYEPMRAYVKTASGVKGWIFIDPTTDEYGKPVNPVVK